jgi:hypothetical protein
MFKKIKIKLANLFKITTSSNPSKNALKQKCLLLIIVASLCVPAHKANADIWTTVGDGILWLVQAVVYIVAFALLQFAALFVKIGAYLVDVMLQEEIYAIVFDINTVGNPLMSGWTIIRDFANTFFIFILLVIAFSTILRISKYSAKNLLPKFVIALFLINFSAVITLIVIDFGQVFMYEIVDWMGNGFGGNNGAMGNLTSIVDNEFLTTYKGYGHIDGTGYSMQNAIGVSFALAFTIIMGCVYIMLAGFLLIRLTVLAILVVLSPIAFLGIIMPGLSSHAATWWRKLFEYSLFGPIFIFFVFLSSQMANSLVSYPVDASAAGLNWLASFVAIIVPYCVAIVMLLAVVPVTKQLGIAGTGALMGGALGVGKIMQDTRGVGKKGWGYGKKATGWTGRRANVDSRKIGDVLRGGTKKVVGKIPTKIGKQIGTRVEGHIVLQEAKQKAEDRKNIEEKKSEIKELSGKSAVIAAKGIEAKKFRAGESLSKEDETKFIALMEHAASKGEDINDRDNFSEAQLTMAAHRGANLDNIAKYDPTVAGKMKQTIDKSKTAEGHTEAYMQEHAETGDWKKYNGHFRENNFDKISEHIDSKDLQNHIKHSGKKANLNYEIGADKWMQELYKAMNVATGTAKTDLQDELKKAQRKVRKATGNLEISDAKRSRDGYRYDDTGLHAGSHTRIGHGEKAATGNVDIHTTGIQDGIKVSGGADFKKLTKNSKILFAKHVQAGSGALKGLRLREEDSETLQKMADEIKARGDTILTREAKDIEVLDAYM